MRLLVVSDIHGRYERLAKLIDSQKGIDALIFLGDGLSDLDRADAYDRGISVISVKGLCCIKSAPPIIAQFTAISGRKIPSKEEFYPRRWRVYVLGQACWCRLVPHAQGCG